MGWLCRIFEAGIVVTSCPCLNVLLASEFWSNCHVFSCVANSEDSTSQLDLQACSLYLRMDLSWVVGLCLDLNSLSIKTAPPLFKHFLFLSFGKWLVVLLVFVFFWIRKSVTVSLVLIVTKISLKTRLPFLAVFVFPCAASSTESQGGEYIIPKNSLLL